jgi:hypothetical protein
MHAPVRFMTPSLVYRVKPPLPAGVRVGMGVWFFHTPAVGRMRCGRLTWFFHMPVEERMRWRDLVVRDP